ncbi:endonuclease NucS [archaeon SCG-AAA382B04]|nr:endonuclease NucS [archaeon SCG-AAA382B04]
MNMKKVVNIENPLNEKTDELIKKSLRKNRVIEIFGKCVIEYEGRASSHLGLGDRLILLKPDGTLLVHTKNQREPVNWQPPGSRHYCKTKDQKLVVISKRKSPEEKLVIEFFDVFSISSLDLVDEEELELNRSEEEMGDLLVEKPWIIEKGFSVIKREKETELGYIDLFGEDDRGNKVIIELKRKRISLSAVSQLKRYYDSLKNKYTNLRGLIVGPSVSEKSKNLLNEHGLEFVKLKPEACELGTDLTEYIDN